MTWSRSWLRQRRRSPRCSTGVVGMDFHESQVPLDINTVQYIEIAIILCLYIELLGNVNSEFNTCDKLFN